MRALAVLFVLIAAPANAEPTPPSSAPRSGPPVDAARDASPVLPNIGEPQALIPVPGKTPQTGAPAFGGGWAAGRVLEPPPHPDARPYPRGIVIEPPDVNDPMAIELGTDQRGPARLIRGSWWQAFGRGIDAVVDLMVPRPT